MKKKVFVFAILVLIAPLVFLIYYKNNLVCLPRAIRSSFLFGVIPLLFVIIAYRKQLKSCFYIALSVLLLECISTPIIMLKKLGWEKFYNERLLAFFTFEFFSIIQIVLVMLMLEQLIKGKLE